MIRYLILLLAIVVFSCQNYNFERTTKSQLASEIRRKVAVSLKKQNELYPCGTGSQMMDKIKMLALSFDYYKPIDIESGRKLLILAANKFIDEVNADQRIHSYLYNYPFTSKNVEIRIFLRNLNGSPIPPEKLHVISMIDGILKYDIIEEGTNFLKTIYREPYSEAMQKIGEN